jgi:nucleoside-diphosphate-sugar epimerase
MPGSALIGYSGFVGGNLAAQFPFDDNYNSKNIQDIRRKSYDLIVCCGVSAVKWKANRFPGEDREAVERLLNNLQFVKAERFILISTVDVYPSPEGVDEDSDPHAQPNHTYGTNRLYVEDTVRRLFATAYVVRLPGLFGPGLKKNVIYDLMHDNVDAIHPEGQFQYYDVRRLWRDLQVVTTNNLRLVNIATEPIVTSEMVRKYFPAKRLHSSTAPPPSYNVRSLYESYFGGSGGYLFTAEQILADLGDWIRQDQKRGDAA